MCPRLRPALRPMLWPMTREHGVFCSEGTAGVVLPEIRGEADHRRVCSDSELWLPAMDEIARRHWLGGAPTRPPPGTSVVYDFADLVFGESGLPGPLLDGTAMARKHGGRGRSVSIVEFLHPFWEVVDSVAGLLARRP